MTKPIVDTTQAEVGKETVVTQKGSLPKDLLGELETKNVAVATELQLKANKLELEEFMNEPVEILIMEPQDALMGETWVVPLTVIPLTQRVMRGIPQVIKRKYVEILARARRASVTATGYRDSTGEAINDFRRASRAMEYPFQVLADPSGQKGMVWLQDILRAER